MSNRSDFILNSLVYLRRTDKRMGKQNGKCTGFMHGRGVGSYTRGVRRSEAQCSNRTSRLCSQYDYYCSPSSVQDTVKSIIKITIYWNEYLRGYLTLEYTIGKISRIAIIHGE